MGLLDTITNLFSSAESEVEAAGGKLLTVAKSAYGDLAPIAVTGASLFGYSIPGDAVIKRLQGEAQTLTNYAYQLKALVNQLLKAGDASIKAQQDDLRNQAAQILQNANAAVSSLNNAVASIKKIQANTAAGQSVSISDTSQIATLVNNAEQIFQNAMNEVGQSISQIKMFFQQNTVAPSQVGIRQIAQTVGQVASQAGGNAVTALVGAGQSAESIAKGIPAAAVSTGKLLEYLPWIVGGVVLIGGIIYVSNLPKPKGGFSFGD